MRAFRFLLWNAGIKLCGVLGGPINRIARWYENRTGRESPFYGCQLHPARLINSFYDDIPETWWQRTGWHKP
jgi:hypothetical protein